MEHGDNLPTNYGVSFNCINKLGVDVKSEV